jgi:hypothetical protein
MIMHIGYNNGYNDALRDVLSWFENHRCFFAKKPHKIVCVILSRFWKQKDDFFREKECYEFEFTHEEIKATGMKIFPPDPPRWKITQHGEGYCYGLCPKCKQEQFFFTADELIKTEICCVCKTRLLPPKEEVRV